MFKEPPFYNALIEELCIKHLDNIDVLRELPFSYNELNIVKNQKHFKDMQDVHWNNRFKRPISAVKN